MLRTRLATAFLLTQFLDTTLHDAKPNCRMFKLALRLHIDQMIVAYLLMDKVAAFAVDRTMLETADGEIETLTEIDFLL